jgi:hypothetical protein
VLGFLLALQSAGPAACASPPLCRVLESAAAANRTAMNASGGYRAIVETETATLGRRESRIEGATLLEQTSSTARWSSSGGLEQHVVGSRSFPNAIPLSRLAFLRIGWVAPILAGERIAVIGRNAPGETRFTETLSGPLAPELVVHPLASNRDTYYAFSGGDTVTRMIDGIARRVVRIEVLPVADFHREDTVFEGEMNLDPESGAVIRLVGRIQVIGKVKRGMLSLPDLFEPTVTLVDLINQRLSDGSWVPLVQRFEIQTASSLASGHGAARRVISRFYAAEPLPRRAGGAGSVTTGYVLTSAPGDSLRSFRGWRTRAGAMTDAVSEADFGRFRPERLQPNGPPIVVIQGYNSGDFFRLNRIEGIFTGISTMARLRDAAPGVSMRVTAGYAWWERTVRGAAGAAWATGRWSLEGGVARSLDITSKFRDQFDNPRLSALGRDNWDYLERQGGGLALSRRLDNAGSIARLELAGVEDRAVERHMETSLLRRPLRVNRNITEGGYFRTRLLFDLNPAVSPLFARDGIAFRAELEHAGGDLDYTRVEARAVLRQSAERFFLITRLHAGAVFADTPPPQQLFELGGPAGLPGYEYKEFAGDRAVLFRTRITYPLALLDTPLRIGSGITLPSLAPAISLGFQAGYADTRTAGGAAAVRALGDRRDDATDEVVIDQVTGNPLPASVAGTRVRTSVDIRVGIFGDALAVGLARALEKGRKTQLILAFGRQF